nr:unnamed protein product [Callosobruchus analis]
MKELILGNIFINVSNAIIILNRESI